MQNLKISILQLLLALPLTKFPGRNQMHTQASSAHIFQKILTFISLKSILHTVVPLLRLEHTAVVNTVWGVYPAVGKDWFG